MQNHYIYVISSDEAGPVKLGISYDPEKRVRQLQTGHAKPLTIWHKEPITEDRVRVMERLLHRDNRHHRMRGEWFNLTVEHAIAYVLFTIIEYDLVPTDILEKQLSKK